MIVTRKKKEVMMIQDDSNLYDSNSGDEVRNIATALEADEEIGNLEGAEVAIFEEVTEVLERRQKDKLLDIYQRRSC